MGNKKTVQGYNPDEWYLIRRDKWHRIVEAIKSASDAVQKNTELYDKLCKLREEIHD